MNHKAPSRELEAPAHTRRKPSFRNALNEPKTLNFETPKMLVNRLGEKFNVSLDLKEHGKVCTISISCKDRPAGELNVEIRLIAFPEFNTVVLSSMKQGSGDYLSYNSPSEQNKGYGFMRIALAFARTLARREGITTISTTPYCLALAEYYKQFGFRENTDPGAGNIHKLILDLQG